MQTGGSSNIVSELREFFVFFEDCSMTDTGRYRKA